MLSSKFSHVNGHSTSLHTCLHFVPLTPSKSTNPLFPPLKGSCNSVPYTFVALYFVLALQSLIYLDAPLQWCLPLLCPDQTPFVQTRPFVVLSEHISYTLSSSASLWPLHVCSNFNTDLNTPVYNSGSDPHILLHPSVKHSERATYSEQQPASKPASQ